MNIFLEQSVTQAVETLRRESWMVEHKFLPDDPEYANGYVIDSNDRDQIFAIISSVVRWRRTTTDWDLPELTKSCVQLIPSTRQYHSLRELVWKKFSIVKENENIKTKG